MNTGDSFAVVLQITDESVVSGALNVAFVRHYVELEKTECYRLRLHVRVVVR